jgi:hypothetical protein
LFHSEPGNGLWKRKADLTLRHCKVSYENEYSLLPFHFSNNSSPHNVTCYYAALRYASQILSDLVGFVSSNHLNTQEYQMKAQFIIVFSAVLNNLTRLFATVISVNQNKYFALNYANEFSCPS